MYVSLGAFHSKSSFAYTTHCSTHLYTWKLLQSDISIPNWQALPSLWKKAILSTGSTGRVYFIGENSTIYKRIKWRATFFVVVRFHQRFHIMFFPGGLIVSKISLLYCYGYITLYIHSYNCLKIARKRVDKCVNIIIKKLIWNMGSGYWVVFDVFVFI